MVFCSLKPEVVLSFKQKWHFLSFFSFWSLIGFHQQNEEQDTFSHHHQNVSERHGEKNEIILKFP